MNNIYIYIYKRKKKKKNKQQTTKTFSNFRSVFLWRDYLFIFFILQKRKCGFVLIIYGSGSTQSQQNDNEIGLLFLPDVSPKKWENSLKSNL